MRKTYTLPAYDLQLFSDGAAAGGAAAGSAGDGAAQGAETGALPKADTKSTRGSSRRGNSGAYDNVVFGKQDAAAETDVTTNSAAGSKGEGNAKTDVITTSNTLEDNRKAFEELISGEYKDAFTERTQQIIDRRFKESKEMEQTITSQKPIIDMLMQKYRIADGDVSKLQKAIEQDDTYWEKEAEESGLSIEQYKQMQKLERDSAELQRIRQRQQGEQQAQEQLSKWYREAESMKGKYPSFDFRAECQNREFLGLLKAGVGVEHAYRTIHMDEINEATARAAAQTASEQMAANIKAKAARPAENGTSRQSAVIVKSDVHSLSKADRAEIVRRAMRGEKISY
jgi:hypothetical protein